MQIRLHLQEVSQKSSRSQILQLNLVNQLFLSLVGTWKSSIVVIDDINDLDIAIEWILLDLECNITSYIVGKSCSTIFVEAS